MGYDRGDNFPIDFEPNGIQFGSENLKENSHHDHIPFNVKGDGNTVFSVHAIDGISMGVMYSVPISRISGLH